ncbi:hypothetical protein, partial [Oleiagrimonas sp.]|uniref:hypothetical protein n=1 Tax=Oleiagrimonas sp. TaxID=2010330 RepID=UPI002602F75B
THTARMFARTADMQMNAHASLITWLLATPANRTPSPWHQERIDTGIARPGNRGTKPTTATICINASTTSAQMTAIPELSRHPRSGQDPLFSAHSLADR